MLKRIIYYLISALVVALFILLLVLIVNTFQNESPTRKGLALTDTVFSHDTLKSAEHRLSGAIKIKTLSNNLAAPNGKKLAQRYFAYLKQSYPKLHDALTLTLINEKSFVYHWSSSQQKNKLKPILLLAHYDVVPAQGQHWLHPAFSGFNDGKFIWGRGSLDNKSSMLAMFEAIEQLLKQGHAPERDVFFAFGHDEETGGEHGAKQIAEYFAKLDLEFEMVLDEGLVITEGVIKLIPKPVALIGIAEKGLLNLELSLEQLGGHASMPGNKTAVGQMSKALHQLEDNPVPARLSYPVTSMLSRLARDAGGLNRVVLSNLWLFQPFVVNKFKQAPATHAAVNTTIAATQLNASNEINVLPTRVTANLNIRILPGDSIRSVQQHIKATINNPKIQLRIIDGGYEPSRVSMMDNRAYQQIEHSIFQVYPDVLVAPGLVLAATDSRHYRHLTNNIYRFMPLRLSKEDLARIHGENERILIQDYHAALQFYWQLLMNAAIN